MNKIKVLWFSNTPAAGDEYISSNGTGGWLKSLDKAIQDKVELHVAFYDRHYPAEFTVGKTTYHQLALQDKKSLIKRRIQLKFGKTNPDLPQYLEVIKRVQPDIIHIHGTERRWIELAEHTDIPVLLSIQAILTVMNHKYFSGINSTDLPCMSAYKKAYYEFLKAGYIERENLQYVNYVMGRTDWDRRVYAVLAPHAKYFVGGEVLRDSFYSTVWQFPNRNDGKVIVHSTTGALLFKGLETICAAVNSLNKAGVNVEWRVAGVDVNSDFVRIVRKKLGDGYPTKGLKLLGSLDEKSLVKKMLEADVYVSPSHQDNSPNALCEATLMGMPCVSTYAGGSGSIIKDGETGIMVQDGDPWAMAGAVLELANNNQLAMTYAKSAREAALTRHDKENVVKQVLEAYQEILKERK